MIAFKVSINGEHKCLAGLEGTGVLSSILTWSSRPADLVALAPEASRAEAEQEHVGLHVGGLSSDGPLKDQHHNWGNFSLGIGDRLEVEILESNSPDPPSHSSIPDLKALKIESQKNHVRSLCDEWGWSIQESATE